MHSTTSGAAARTSVAIRRPGRPALLAEGAEALLRLGARPLSRDDARGMPFRRAVAQPAYLAHDRLRGAGRRGTGGEDVGDRRVHGQVERRLALDDLVDQPD